MTITEVKQALGSWQLRLRESTPRAILDQLTYFGHIAVLPNQVNPVEYGDNLLSAARYVGVFRRRDAQNEFILNGSGMAYWLGDEDGKGDVFESPVSLNNATFAASISALLPPSGSVIAGVINSIAGTYTGEHRWQTPRQALDYVTSIYSAEWRVNGNATLDAGTVAQLYETDPKAILMRKKEAGRDLNMAAFPGKMALNEDVEDYTTRVVLLAEGEGNSIATGSANGPATPYNHLHGGDVKIVRLVSESETSSTNANARAQLALSQFQGKRQAVSLSTDVFDIKGDFAVGDYLNVYDPDNGFYDNSREVYWEGQPINPVALRCVEMTWPIPEGWTVAFRTVNGVWLDLSPYYAPESGETTVVVGALNRSVTVAAEPIGIRPNLPEGGGADSTIPAAPAFTGWNFGAYQSADTNDTKAVIRVQWSTPLNLDASVITDGDHYEIRYRIDQVLGYAVKWGQLEAFKWGELETNRWAAPVSDAVEADPEWHYLNVPWGTNEATILELTPGVRYEFQIRAVDSANPPHQGPYSASSFQTTTGDLFPPSTPAAPTVASSIVAIQVTHSLGKASGGTFNLEPDLVRLNVHVGGSDHFFPDDSNKVGDLPANIGMMLGAIAAVGTFTIPQTDGVWVRVVAVDRMGNKSSPSAAVQATAELIDDAHITDLSVSKVTAGTIMANWLLSAAIRTALSGARVEISSTGIRAYNTENQNTVNIDAATGTSTFTGTIQTLVNGNGITILPGVLPQIRLTPNGPYTHYGRLLSWQTALGVSAELSVRRASDDAQDGGKLALFDFGAILSMDKPSTPELYLGLGWPYSGVINFKGKFPNGYGIASDDALWCVVDNTFVTPHSFGAASYVYGATMSEYMGPVTSILWDSGTVERSNLTVSTATGFTVGWGGTAPNFRTKAVFTWAFRAGAIT